jgi:protein-S-isoprenylcysteine O-methyltransferase Ste14
MDLKTNHSTAKKALGRLCFITVLVALCLFGTAGTISWINGWIFMIAYVLVLITLTGVVFHSSPELVRERMEASHKAKSWDRVFVPLLAMVLPLLAVILAGLDHRYGWTHDFGTLAIIISLTVMLMGNAITLWAMRENRFFSSHVRIQSDRGHYVITSGPYRWIRHPGYTGSIMFNVAAPVLLGSFPALAVGIFFTLLMATRTVLEDATLRNELPGYDDYTKKTRWRLFPFIW